MAVIVVRCPTCDTRLEVAAEHRGREVQCGSCAERFVAAPDRPSRRDDDGDDGWDRRPRRRDDGPDEDDDRPRRRRRDDGTSGMAVAGLVCGGVSVGLAVCPCVFMVGLPLAGVGLLFSGLAIRNPESRTAARVGLGLNVAAAVVWTVWMSVWFQPQWWFGNNAPNNPWWNNLPGPNNPPPPQPGGPGWRP